MADSSSEKNMVIIGGMGALGVFIAFIVGILIMAAMLGLGALLPPLFLAELVPYAGQGGGRNQTTAQAGGSGGGQLNLNNPSRPCQDLYQTLQRNGVDPAVFNEAAERWGVPVDLLIAQAEQESAFNPRARSAVGAQGLFQIKPDTWTGLVEANASVPNNPNDPRASAYYGAKYMRQMYDRYGSWKLALAAYNAGPGNVDRYGRKIPPFRETQNYVHRITRRQGHYGPCVTRTNENPNGSGVAGSYPFYQKAQQLGLMDNHLARRLAQNTSSDCYRNTNKFFLYMTANSDGQRQQALNINTANQCYKVTRDGYGFSPDSSYLKSNLSSQGGAPPADQIQITRARLEQGHYVQWYIQGNYSGQHWVSILAIDNQNNVTYYDPGDGRIKTDHISKPSRRGGGFFDHVNSGRQNGNLWGGGYHPTS